MDKDEEVLRKILLNNTFRHETDDDGYWAFLDSDIETLIANILKHFQLKEEE